MVECFMASNPDPMMGADPCKAGVDCAIEYTLGSGQVANAIRHEGCVKHCTFLARSVLNYAKDKDLYCVVRIERATTVQTPPGAPESSGEGRSKARAKKPAPEPGKAPELGRNRTGRKA
jgi:hypothetical protein